MKTNKDVPSPAEYQPSFRVKLRFNGHNWNLLSISKGINVHGARTMCDVNLKDNILANIDLMCKTKNRKD